MKNEVKREFSLRGRLTGALLAAVLLFALLQAAVTYRTARAETEALFDAQMQRIALSLSGGLAAGALNEADPPADSPAAQEMPRTHTSTGTPACEAR